MIILAIDTGTRESAYVQTDLEANEILSFGKVENEMMLDLIDDLKSEHLVCETFKSFGNYLGDSILESCIWLGRFVERYQICTNYRNAFTLIPRKSIVTTLCNNPRANDKNVRQALIDRYSDHPKANPKARIPAIGDAKKPGPLYGMTADVWSALAVALAFKEQRTNVDKESAAIDSLLM